MKSIVLLACPNDNDRVNKVKRLFLDESLAEVKANLQDMLGKLLANEWTRFHADNPAANEALKAKIEENKTAIMLGLTYLNRYYDLQVWRLQPQGAGALQTRLLW